jgi:hypothetical protein
MTVLSLFVPLVATFFAFWFIGYEMEIPLWRIIVAGPFVGLTSESQTPSSLAQVPGAELTLQLG